MHRVWSCLTAAAVLTVVTCWSAPAFADDSDPYPRVLLPELVPPQIGFAYGYGYQHPELPPRDCDPRISGVPRSVKVSTKAVPGGISVSFYSTNDPDVSRFSVAADSEQLVAGNNPLPTWKSVAKPKGCRVITATVTGLKKGVWYDIWVDALLVRRVGAPGLLDRNIAQSGAFQAG